jgi:hypothetical protein
VSEKTSEEVKHIADDEELGLEDAMSVSAEHVDLAWMSEGWNPLGSDLIRSKDMIRVAVGGCAS